MHATFCRCLLFVDLFYLESFYTGHWAKDAVSDLLKPVGSWNGVTLVYGRPM